MEFFKRREKFFNIQALVLAFYALNPIVLGAAYVYNSFRPSEVPAFARPFPSATAKVIKVKQYGSRHVLFDTTFEYKVAGHTYTFEEDDVEERLKSCEVKYNPKAPEQCVRIMGDSEIRAGFLPGLLVMEVGVLLAMVAFDKWRKDERPQSKVMTGILLLPTLWIVSFYSDLIKASTERAEDEKAFTEAPAVVPKK